MLQHIGRPAPRQPGWLLVPLAVAVLSGWTTHRFVFDPADLTAYAMRGANAAERLPGRADEPPYVGPAWRPGDGEASERFYLEYPPLALGLFRLEAWLVGLRLPPGVADAHQTDVAHHEPRTDVERELWAKLRACGRLHVWLMLAAAVALWRVLPGPGWLVALPGAAYFGLFRYDVLPALATALAFWDAERGRWGRVGVWLAVGAGLKLYPVLFLPVLWRLGGWRVVVGFAITLFGFAMGCVAAVGVEGTLAPLRVQLTRPPELGGWTLYGRLLPTALAYSSVGRLALLAGVVLACVATRPADVDAVRRRCGVVLLAFTQLAVFWSPQWLVWFLPLVVGRRTVWAMVAVDLTNYLSFPGLWHVGWGLLGEEWRQPVAEGLIVLRTLAWAWLGWRFLRDGPRLPPAGFRVAELREAVTPPRGLRWAGVSRHGAAVLRGRTAFQPVLVWFAPTPDGGLEDVPQATEPRQAVAVYAWDDDGWRPTGKLVFNLSVEQLARLPI